MGCNNQDTENTVKIDYPRENPPFSIYQSINTLINEPIVDTSTEWANRHPLSNL